MCVCRSLYCLCEVVNLIFNHCTFEIATCNVDQFSFKTMSFTRSKTCSQYGLTIYSLENSRIKTISVSKHVIIYIYKDLLPSPRHLFNHPFKRHAETWWFFLSPEDKTGQNQKLIIINLRQIYEVWLDRIKHM